MTSAPARLDIPWRLAGSIATACLAAPGIAQVAPGRPPWSCPVEAACGARGCTPLPAMLARVRVDPGDAQATPRLDGRNAGFYPSEAEAAARTGALPPDASIILVEASVGLGDAVGLRAYAPSQVNGLTGLSDAYASLICTIPTP